MQLVIEDTMRQIWFHAISHLTNRRCTIMQSPHALSQVHKLLAALDKDGYADVQGVKDFREEIREDKEKHKV